MRKARSHGVVSILLGMLTAVVVPACALEADMADDPGEQDLEVGLDPQEDQHDDKVAEDSTATADSDILATPTCNIVVNWSNAAVPAWSGNGSVECNMVTGCVSEAVRQLQRSMNTCHREHLDTDGNFGKLTREAVIRRQRDAGITRDGVYGPNTRKNMRHEGNEVPGNLGCRHVP